MTDVLRFVVEGEPVPKGRARTRIVTPRNGKSFATHYTPGDTKAYEQKVALLARVAVAGARWTWTERDRFDVVLRVFRTHEGKGGDADNYFKSAADGMNRIVFSDDARVRGIGVSLAQDAVRPRLEVTVRKYVVMKQGGRR